MIDGADVSDEEPVFEIEPLAEVRGKRRERGERGERAEKREGRVCPVFIVCLVYWLVLCVTSLPPPFRPPFLFKSSSNKRVSLTYS